MKHQNQNSRDKIFHVAIELFKEQGYTETTMRQIANATGLSLGSTYYYFKSKEEIVNAYYRQTQQQLEQYVASLCQNEKVFYRRMQNMLEFQLNLFKPVKKMLGVLAQNGSNPDHPNSPFHENSKALRDDAIEVIKILLEGSSLKIERALLDNVAYLIWLSWLGILYFWLFDKSDDEQQSKLLLGKGLPLLEDILKMLKNPLLKPWRKKMFDLFENLSPGKK